MGTGNSAGIRLTDEDQAHLSDDELRAAALPALAECNAAARAIDEPESSADDIRIGDWTE